MAHEPEFTSVGKSLPLVDAREKVTGSAKFTTDIALPQMLHGKVLRSPWPHARILSIDVSRAYSLAGVKAVVTADDTPRIPYGHFVTDELPLASEKVRFAGDEVAAVAAVDEETAEEALGLIQVEYEPLPDVLDFASALDPDAPKVHGPNTNVAVEFTILRGDIESSFAEADRVFKDCFTTSLVHQSYLEPTASVADVDPSGRLQLWLPVHMPFVTRAVLAKILQLSVGKIRVYQPYVGGGFGGKYEPRSVFINAILALKAKAPVKLVVSREEEFQAGRPRVPMTIELRTAVKNDGTLLAKDVKITADNGAYSDFAPASLGVAAMRSDCLYRYQSVRTKASLIYTNKVPTGAFRGIGNPQMHFAVESQMDIIAEALNIDPIDLRLKNAVRVGDTTLHGWVLRSCGLTECLQELKEAFPDRDRLATAKSARGIGVACSIHVSGNRAMGDYDGSTAIVKVHEDGSVTLLSGEGDVGQGARTVLAQIAAEELGVRFEDVRSLPVDTEVSPYGLGIWSSRVTTLGGNAVKAAAASARGQLFEIAARILEASISDLEAREGHIFVKGSPARSLTVSEVANLATSQRSNGPVIGIGFFDPDTVPADPKSKYGNISPTYSFAAQAAEVEVDLQTGYVSVVDFVAAHDLGRAVNPMLAAGQIEGGVTQGIGYALTEQMLVKGGKIANPGFIDYKLPTTGDVPNIRSVLVETNDPVGPFGAKSLGELPIIPVAPAIANAVHRATGARIRELPLTPERVHKVLHQ